MNVHELSFTSHALTMSPFKKKRGGGVPKFHRRDPKSKASQGKGKEPLCVRSHAP